MKDLPWILKDHFHWKLGISTYWQLLTLVFCLLFPAQIWKQQLLAIFFAIFGLTAYIHSNQRTAFMLDHVKQFLWEQGVSVSRATLYNPQDNGQCERYNSIIWRSIQLAAANHGFSIDCWESLPETVYAIRTLLYMQLMPFHMKGSSSSCGGALQVFFLHCSIHNPGPCYWAIMLIRAITNHLRIK